MREPKFGFQGSELRKLRASNPSSSRLSRSTILLTRHSSPQYPTGLLYDSVVWTAWSRRAHFQDGDAGPSDLGRGVLQVKHEFNRMPASAE
jgi:hypothetical protein